ncbi:unnamed protein product [Periconia digitata]|uniref:Plasma membrane proteolipid 3 n=1 Tax=Periconia digitata TaxID=1303443 RepID=A0A9W4U6H7_9PLEO|nr:unnamed protein product [Periconia digitata]
MGGFKTLMVILVTLFIPPLGVFFVAGCGMDLLINILLTILGYLPGHVHAFYVEYVYYKRKGEVRAGVVDAKPAPGIYSDKVQRGGHSSRAVARNADANENAVAPATV